MKHAADAILHLEQANYLDRVTAPRDALLAEMEAYAAEHGEPISDPEVAAFMDVVCRTVRPKTIVEVGTNIGYGAIVLARGAPDAKVITIENDPERCAIARRYIDRAGLSARVIVVQGLALEVLDGLESGVDLFYVDCVKEEYIPRTWIAFFRASRHVAWFSRTTFSGAGWSRKRTSPNPSASA